MKFIFLLLSVAMFTVFSAQAQEAKKIMTENKVIIIEKDNAGRIIRKEIMMSENGEPISDHSIDSLIQSFEKNIDFDAKSEPCNEKVITITKHAKTPKSKLESQEFEKNIEVFVNEETGEQKVVMTLNQGDKKMPIPQVSLGIAVTEAVEIKEVMSGSAAEKAGLQEGDKILQVDRQIIYSHRGLLEHLTSYQKNDTAKLTILRNNKEIKIKVKLDVR